MQRLWRSATHPATGALAPAAFLVTLAAVVLAAAPPMARAAAQEQHTEQGARSGGGESLGTLVGVVRDEAGNEIASVEVTALGTSVRAVSDERGAFVLRRVPFGADSIRFRRLGFRPRVLAATIATGFQEPLDVVLATLPLRLPAVAVRSDRPRYTGFMADFYRRRDAGGSGRFYTRAQIDSLHPSRTNDLLRRVAGIHFSRPAAPGQTVVQGRDASCTPLVWLDGMPAASAYFDPDNVDPNDIEGIEVYGGLANVPAALLGPRFAGQCGAIAIWTRIGDPRPKRGDAKTTARHLAGLVDSLQVYTAEQVDVAAVLSPDVPFSPTYPTELRRTRTVGVVIAEFVVDAQGRAEPATFSVVSSTNALFTEAVSDALPSASFRPATLHGRAVRQVVQLPVYFVLPGTTTGGGGGEASSPELDRVARTAANDEGGVP